MSKPQVTLARPAGPEHRVLAIVGGKGTYCRTPCATCPWRKDAVGFFPAQAFRHSANTAYDLSDHTFGCHQAGKDKPATCAGFLLKGSIHNLAVRFAIARGKLDFEAIGDGGGVELFESYREMAVANGVDPHDPALRLCRD